MWTGLQRARARIVDAMQSIGDNLTGFVLPPLNRFADALQKVSDWTNPRTGNPAVGMGVMAAGGVGAFLLARSLLARMGPWSRTLIGGTGGLLLGGDVSSLLMGAMIGRGFGSGGGINPALAAGTAAAGTAGAMAGRAWGGRFMTAARWMLRGLRSMTVWGLAATAATEVVTNWETISERVKKIWEDLEQARPKWLGGQDQGAGAFFLGQGVQDTIKDIEGTARTWLPGSWADWLTRPPTLTTYGPLRGELNRIAAEYRAMGIDLGALQEDARLRAVIPGASPTNTVTVGQVTNNITVNVAGTSASAQAIGEAAGNAVQSGLRGALSDLPPMP
jgi:hypothetical protein